MSTNLRWPFPKDPRDKGWYVLPFSVLLTEVRSVVVLEIPPDFANGGKYDTPGDVIESPLTLQVSDVQLTTDKMNVMMWFTDGKPNRDYAVQAFVIDTSGNELHRSAILPVRGQ